MENFNNENYRDDLAKDLREVKKVDPENARAYLKTAQTTTNYKNAFAQHREEVRLDKAREMMLQEKYAELSKILSKENMYEFIFLKKLTGVSPSQEAVETCFESLKKNSPNLLGEFKESLEENDLKYEV